MYAFRGTVLKKTGGLLIALLLLVSLFKFYRYTGSINESKPPAKFLKKLDIVRKSNNILPPIKVKQQPSSPEYEREVGDRGILVTPIPHHQPKQQSDGAQQSEKSHNPYDDARAPGLLPDEPAKPGLDNDGQLSPGRRLEVPSKDAVQSPDARVAILDDGAKQKGVIAEENQPGLDNKEEVPRDIEAEQRGQNHPTQHSPHANLMLPKDDKNKLPATDEPVKIDGSDAQCVVGRNRFKEDEWMKRDKESSSTTSQEDQDRANKVEEMMMHGWSNYRKYAWGGNELDTEVKRPTNGIFYGTKMGLTIVDSLDTLWMMGLFEEVLAGKEWLVTNLPKELEKDTQVSVFEFNIRFVGGFLSMYALTNECEYKQLAVLCADKLVPAFNTSTGIPVSAVNLKHGFDASFGEYGTAVLAEVGTLHLEFVYTTYISGNPKYRKLVENVRDRLVKASQAVGGLYSNTVHIDGAHFAQGDVFVSLGGAGDSFYEYLYKSYLQSDKRETRAKQLYFDAMKAVIKAGLLKTSFTGLKYFGQRHGNGNVVDSMEHLTCFIGGLIGLSAEESLNQTSTMRLAEELGRTCHESYIRTPARIGPEKFSFQPGREALPRTGDGSHYILRPETVETWFTLQRLTHKNMYKDWAWDFIRALEKNCRREFGYAGLTDVMLTRSSPDGKPVVDGQQQSFFLAETLKYLYLIFKSDDLLPLQDWVFNTEAHPLPVLRHTGS